MNPAPTAASVAARMACRCTNRIPKVDEDGNEYLSTIHESSCSFYSTTPRPES